MPRTAASAASPPPMMRYLCLSMISSFGACVKAQQRLPRRTRHNVSICRRRPSEALRLLPAKSLTIGSFAGAFVAAIIIGQVHNLGLVYVPWAWPQDRDVEQCSDQRQHRRRCQDGPPIPSDGGDAEAHIGADHEQAAVGKIDDPAQAEDQHQSDRDDVEQPAVNQAVEDLNQHRRPLARPRRGFRIGYGTKELQPKRVALPARRSLSLAVTHLRAPPSHRSLGASIFSD
jgi:hypothetical protein